MKGLSQKQINKLWGETGPYSQANLTIQTRILDDKISRVFLIVEVDINPLTYEIIQKHRARFSDDLMIAQLLDNAEYRGQNFGYVASAFEEEFIDNSVMDRAHKSLEYSTDTILRMHNFVIDILSLNRQGK